MVNYFLQLMIENIGVRDIKVALYLLIIRDINKLAKLEISIRLIHIIIRVKTKNLVINKANKAILFANIL